MTNCPRFLNLSELTPTEAELAKLGLWNADIIRFMDNGGGGRGPQRYWAKTREEKDLQDTKQDKC